MKHKPNINFNDEVIKLLTREQLVEQHPHAEKEAGEAWDKVHAKPKTTAVKPAEEVK